MAGTKTGGKNAAATNKRKYGEDFYIRIGSKGGRAERTRPAGFAAMSPERHKLASAKGGRISRRKKD